MFLTRELYESKARSFEGGHWTEATIENRWRYHNQVIELLKCLDIKHPKEVLEMGTMGISCVQGSDTIDYSERWDFPGKRPDYLHDARQTPWPIPDYKYKVFIALRVFMHLVPSQMEAVNEAMRIGRKVIIVVPKSYKNSKLPLSKGISYAKFVEFLRGQHPNLYLPDDSQDFYFWDNENPSFTNIFYIMQSIYQETGTGSPEVLHSPKRSVFMRLKSAFGK